MRNSIILGDCLTVMGSIPDNSIDLILCDLPYGSSKNRWDLVIPFTPLWTQYNRICKKSAAIILFGMGLFTAKLILSNEKDYRYSLIWEKTTPTGFLNANKMPLRSHEDLVVFYKKLPTYNPQKTTGHIRKVSTIKHRKGKLSTNYDKHNHHSYDSTERFPKSILTFATDKQKSTLHPTQKPVALLEYLIKTYSNEGDLVLDNCAGSGSTLLAAKNTKRDYVGIEISEDYYKIMKERLK